MIAIDHNLGDLWFDCQQGLNPAGGNIFTAGIDNQILFAAGDRDIAIIIDAAKVTGIEPAIFDHASRGCRVPPIAFHQHVTAHQYFAVFRNTQFNTVNRWANSIDFDQMRSVR